MMNQLLVTASLLGLMISLVTGLTSSSVEAGWVEQYHQLEKEISNRHLQTEQGLAKAGAEEPGAYILDRQALVWDSDRNPVDIQLRRTEALLNHLKTLPNAPNLEELENQLDELKSQISQPVLGKTTAGAVSNAGFFL
jgi:hypothetical protein